MTKIFLLCFAKNPVLGGGEIFDITLKGPVSGESDKIREYVSNGRTLLERWGMYSRFGRTEKSAAFLEIKYYLQNIK